MVSILVAPIFATLVTLYTAAYAIHAEIHKARLDVLCAAHSHSVYGRAFCATGMCGRARDCVLVLHCFQVEH
jgi:ribulose-5-phosphate 4-epimerase/fuculose-1-phosphate aldolase